MIGVYEGSHVICGRFEAKPMHAEMSTRIGSVAKKSSSCVTIVAHFQLFVSFSDFPKLGSMDWTVGLEFFFKNDDFLEKNFCYFLLKKA